MKQNFDLCLRPHNKDWVQIKKGNRTSKRLISVFGFNSREKAFVQCLKIKRLPQVIFLAAV